MHTPSAFVADEVVAEFGVDPERVRAVHHGVPVLPQARPATARRDRRGPSTFRRAAGATCWPSEPSNPARTTRSWSAPSPRWRPPTPTSPWSWWAATAGVPTPFAAAVVGVPARSRIVRPGYLDDPALADAPGGRRRAGLPVALRRVRLSAAAGHGRSGCRWWPPPAGRSPRWSATGPGSSIPGTRTGSRPASSTPWRAGASVEPLVARGRTRAAAFSWDGMCRRSGRALPGRGACCGGPAVSRRRVLLLAEQLRRSAAGGIGTYVLGLLQGLDALAAADAGDVWGG